MRIKDSANAIEQFRPSLREEERVLMFGSNRLQQTDKAFFLLLPIPILLSIIVIHSAGYQVLAAASVLTLIAYLSHHIEKATRRWYIVTDMRLLMLEQSGKVSQLAPRSDIIKIESSTGTVKLLLRKHSEPLIDEASSDRRPVPKAIVIYPSTGIPESIWHSSPRRAG